jgi:UDP-2,3-diacylglucosamine hydrolase
MEDLPAYFVSDAHLGVNPRGSIEDREARLVEKLKEWRHACTHLVIVGDLFEFWYEYRHYVNRHHFPLYRALADMVDAGVQVHYLCGNHDFALGSFFPESLGVQVHQELVLEIQDKRLYFMHGDGIPVSDRGYRLARRIVDQPLNRWLFQCIHPDIGMDMARWVGHHSRKLGESREIAIDEYLAAARQRMQLHHCDVCVHGHHHVSGIWDVPEGIVVSTGQWLFSLEYAKMSHKKIELIKLDSK